MNVPSMPPTIDPSTSLGPGQRKIDLDHLRLLAVFHFVGAGFSLLGLAFLAAHYALFRTVFMNPKFFGEQGHEPFPKEFFEVLKWFYLIGAVFMVTSGVLNLLSGIWLRARKFRTFSLIVAGLNCLHVPLGTILGAFTFVVLLRDSVKRLYDESQTSI
jgi:hypothetical protein